MPQSFSSCSCLDNISGIILKHDGDEIPPCLTPFWIWNSRDSLLLTISLLYPSCIISASIVTVSGLQPAWTRVSYNCGLRTESKAFFKSIIQQYSLPLRCCCRFAIVSRMKTWSYHDLPYLNPPCSSESMSCSLKSSCSLFLIILSMTLYHMLRSDIGLWSAGLRDAGVVFGSNMMLACFIACGTFLSVHIR